MLAEALGPERCCCASPAAPSWASGSRALLKDPGLELDPRAELLLFCAARAELCARGHRPRHRRGRRRRLRPLHRLHRRLPGGGAGLGIELVEGLNAVAVGASAARPDAAAADRSRRGRAPRAAAAGRRRRGRRRPLRGRGDRVPAARSPRPTRSSPPATATGSSWSTRGRTAGGVHARIMAAVEERRSRSSEPRSRRRRRTRSREATAASARGRAALSAALSSPTHAFMFTGPPGTGKRAAARAFAAELLADGAPDPGRRPPPRARRPLAASRPRLARAARAPSTWSRRSASG